MEYISEKQFDFYWRWGYLCLEEFFTGPEVDQIYSALRAVASEDFKIMLNVDRPEDLSSQSPFSDPDDQKKVSKLIRGVQLNKRMVGVLEELYEREMVCVQSIIIFKERGTPFANQAWNPHQDNSYILNPNGLYLAVGYPLLDFSPENGGLYVYPGSHKEGILPYENFSGVKKIKAGESAGNTCVVPEKYEKIDVCLKKGGVIVMHGDLIHGSYPNNSNQSRPFLLCNYVPYGEEFLPGRTSNRKVIRCH